jgi:cellulose synthase operon protein C
MLTGRPAACLALALLLALTLTPRGARAQDDEPDDGLHRPERLTVGVADELIGQLGPGGKTLYFVSNRNTASQIFAQNVSDGRAHMLFDDDADVTWPRISPDGKRMLYISFVERASGQLCVRDLPDGGSRRCLDEPSAALQAEWIDDRRIAVVCRLSVKGDLRLLDVALEGSGGAKLSARPLLDRNLTSPAVSPDGRWLVYVPVARYVEAVGPAFAAHAAARLEAVRLASPGEAAIPIDLDLPGVTGQPAFARDGRSLYIVQFFSDTNHDGMIDASDRGVLFRVPLSFEGGAAHAGPPEQLTDTSWNCEYPAPSTDRLITTCSRESALDVYALPLDGEVPGEWTPDQIATETLTAATRVDRQLLASRRLALETEPSVRRLAMLGLAMLHLDLEQYVAAAFYAQHVADLHDRTTAGVSHPLLVLVDQRRAARDREEGRMIGKFGEQARQRLDQLHPKPTASPMAVAFSHVVRSEIHDSLREKTQARAELEAVSLDRTTPGPIVEAYYQRADAMYRELDDREALVAVCRRLAESQGISGDERLRYARAAVRAMVRGLAFDEAGVRIDRERAGAATGPDSEMAFALDVARLVLAIRDAHPPASVAGALIALYTQQSRPGRRHALVDDAVRRATELGADDLVETLAQRNIEEVPRGTRERRSAERLYRRVMTGRAFQRESERRFDDARADFDAVARETGSYEAVVGSIDMRLKAGQPPAAVEAAYAAPGTAPALSRFVRAYVLARQLPKLEGDAHARAAAEALAALHASWSDLKAKRIAQALDGALLHEEYLRTGDLASVEKANLHYLIALELAGRNPRFRAMILGQLGLLHAQVGNYRIALGYLLERDALPYTDNSASLAVHLAKARALLHVGRDAEAATAADDAIGILDRVPGLARYRVLALDRAAVDNLAAGRFSRALALYDAEIPLVAAAQGPLSERNRFVAHMSRAAASLGAAQPARALDDLAAVDRDLADPRAAAALRWPHASLEHVLRTYRLIATGLRAQASADLGRLDAEARAIDARRAILEERFVRAKRVEFERQVMLAEAQLAVNAGERHDTSGAAAWIGRATARADDLRARAGGELGPDQLDVLLLAAELTVAVGAPLVGDLPQRLQAASVALAARRDPTLRSYARRLEIYLPLTSPASATPAVAGRDAPSPAP